MIGCARFMYNTAVSESIKNSICGTRSTSKDIESIIPVLRQQCIWLNECPSQVLQAAVRQVSTDNDWKYRSKKWYNSIRFPQGVRIRFKDNTIQIPKVGKITCIYDRRFTGKIKTVTLYKTATNKYFVKILVESQKKDTPKKQVTEQTTIGISTGINTWYALSNGTRISKPARITSSEKNVRIQQQSLSRKMVGSNRRQRQLKRLLLAKERLHNQKRDYLQKVTTKIIVEYDTIVIESIPGELKDMLKYKSIWYGNNLIEIGICTPCPSICSSCGTISNTESISWVCNQCNTLHNRNKNNAENIKKLGLRSKPSITNVPKVLG